MSRLLHLALGDSAAGCLREACRNHGLPGKVFGIPDDLSHGPLDDGRARVDYMRSCFQGYDDWWGDDTDAFASWRALLAQIDEEKIDSIVIWSGDNVSEATFLAMACWWFADYRGQVLQVRMPEADGRHHVALYPPGDLAGLFGSATDLTRTGRDAIAADFLRIRDETGLLRYWEKETIRGIPQDRYDPLLLSSCTPEWTMAARVIGLAMSRCESHNRMSDLFFSCRLQHLIDAGLIEADGDRKSIRDYVIRLAGT